mmetsp:Transcript_35157/g.64195  ORF Transcript_35157/g.64195 Transcript_35157/m.64195 type:complete len:387 (-) Transcript_35157:34-1194(-)
MWIVDAGARRQFDDAGQPPGAERIAEVEGTTVATPAGVGVLQSLSQQVTGQNSSESSRPRHLDPVEIVTILFTALGVCQHIFSVVATALVVGSSRHAGDTDTESRALGGHSTHVTLLACALILGLCHELSRILALFPTRIVEARGMTGHFWQLFAKASRRVAINWCMLSIVAGPLHLLQAMVVYFAIIHEHKTIFSVSFVVLAVLEFCIVFVTPSLWNQPGYEEGEWTTPTGPHEVEDPMVDRYIEEGRPGYMAPRRSNFHHPEKRVEMRDFALTSLVELPPEAEISCNNMCSICMSPFANGEIISQLPCYHMYHYECIRLWLARPTSRGCPMRCQQKRFAVVSPLPDNEQGESAATDDVNVEASENSGDIESDQHVVSAGHVLDV